MDRITVNWNGFIAQVLGGAEDARDIYVRQVGLQELMQHPGFCLRFCQENLARLPVEDALSAPQ